MGWQVKIKEETGKEPKYRIWATITDGWITEWSTKEEITKFFFWNRFHNFIDGFLEDAMTFPHGYINKDTHNITVNSKSHNEFTKLMTNRYEIKDSDSAIDKFVELLAIHNIEMKINDKRGYGFDSTEK